MKARLSLDDFEANRDDYDRGVLAEPEVDRFCSRTEWILPFHEGFEPDRELHLYRRDRAFLALAAGRHPHVGLYLEALEAMWRFACPLIGPGAPDLLAEVHGEVAAAEGVRGVPLLLSGIPVEGTLVRSLATRLQPHHRLRAVDVTLRSVASLEGGLDGFLGRRRASLRRNLRAARRRARGAGVHFERLQVPNAASVDELYRRILAIEAQSWKSEAGIGVDRGPMRDFYRNVLPRLVARGGLRVIVAVIGDREVGYLHGGVVADHFRGLQMSFDRTLAALSLGNLLQLEMIEALCEEGVSTYDLGSHSPYKERWAETAHATVTLACSPL